MENNEDALKRSLTNKTILLTGDVIIKLKHIWFTIIIILVVIAVTTPSSSKYNEFLALNYGLDCEIKNVGCVNTKVDRRTDVIHNFLFLMVAETYIFGNRDNNIRVIGFLNNFFVLENNLKSQ